MDLEGNKLLAILTSTLLWLGALGCDQTVDEADGQRINGKPPRAVDALGFQLAPAQGAIEATHLSELIKAQADKPRPNREVLIQRVIREEAPLRLGDAPIRKQGFAQLSAKEQQLIAVLCNRGQLAWAGQELVDYLGKPVSRARLGDYAERVELSLAYYRQGSEACRDQKACQSGGFSLAVDEGPGFVDEAPAGDKANTLVSSLGIMTAVGTFFWGHREWVSNNNAIKAAEDAYRVSHRLNQLEARLELGRGAQHETPFKVSTPTVDELRKVRRDAAGDLFDPSSAKFGKYIFSPLLIVTSMIALGVTLNELD